MPTPLRTTRMPALRFRSRRGRVMDELAVDALFRGELVVRRDEDFAGLPPRAWLRATGPAMATR